MPITTPLPDDARVKQARRTHDSKNRLYKPLLPHQSRRQPLPTHAHSCGQGHRLGTLWEPAAIMVCTALMTTPTGFCVLQKPGDKVPFIEIEVPKLLKGLQPRPGTLSSSPLSFCGTPSPHVYTATHARPPHHSSVRVSRLIAARICSSPCRSANLTAASLICTISRRMRHSPMPLNSGGRITSRWDNSSSNFSASKFDLILGSWAAVPWWTQQEIASSSGFDSVAVAPYLFDDFNNSSSTEAIFGPMMSQPEMIDSRPDGYMVQQSKAAKTTRLSVYEVNLGSMTGSAAISQSDIDHAIPSMGAGLALADHMLLMLRDLGITNQCLFALPEYVNNFTAPGPKRMIPLWGAVIDMGGQTNLRRPQFLTEQLANEAILPTMLATHVTGPAHTWDQPLSSNDKIKLDHAQLIQTFSFVEGRHHSLILLNLSRNETIPVTFTGAVKPIKSVNESQLTAASITDSNEQSERVAIRRKQLPAFDPNSPYRLPPYSMTVLRWDSSR